MTNTLSQFVTSQLRAELGRRRLNQAALARLLGDSEAKVSRQLSDKQPLTIDDLERIMIALNMPVSYFIQRPTSLASSTQAVT